MNFIITVDSDTTLKELLSTGIKLINKKELTQREIYTNVCGFDCENSYVKKLTFNRLKKFVVDLLERRKQQVAELHYKPGAIFYLWYDEQAMQIRFNILSGKDRKLPFYCAKVVTLARPDSILKHFLEEAKEYVIKMEELESEPDDGEGGIDSIRVVDASEFDDYEEPEYTAYVYAKRFD